MAITASTPVPHVSPRHSIGSISEDDLDSSNSTVLGSHGFNHGDIEKTDAVAHKAMNNGLTEAQVMGHQNMWQELMLSKVSDIVSSPDELSRKAQRIVESMTSFLNSSREAAETAKREKEDAIRAKESIYEELKQKLEKIKKQKLKKKELETVLENEKKAKIELLLAVERGKIELEKGRTEIEKSKADSEKNCTDLKVKMARIEAELEQLKKNDSWI